MRVRCAVLWVRLSGRSVRAGSRALVRALLSRCIWRVLGSSAASTVWALCGSRWGSVRWWWGGCCWASACWLGCVGLAVLLWARRSLRGSASRRLRHRVLVGRLGSRRDRALCLGLRRCLPCALRLVRLVHRRIRSVRALWDSALHLGHLRVLLPPPPLPPLRPRAS